MALPRSLQRFGVTQRRLLVALLAVAAVLVIAVAFATTIVTSLMIVAGSICLVAVVDRLTEARGDVRPPDGWCRRPLPAFLPSPFNPASSLKRELPES